jgi:hypothetical protein
MHAPAVYSKQELLQRAPAAARLVATSELSTDWSLRYGT